MPWSPPRPRPRPVHGLPLIFLFLFSIPRPRPGPFPLPRPLCPTETQTRIKQWHQAAMNHLMKRVSVVPTWLLFHSTHVSSLDLLFSVAPSSLILGKRIL